MCVWEGNHNGNIVLGEELTSVVCVGGGGEGGGEGNHDIGKQ